MQKITFPINPRTAPDVISNLHKALTFLGYKINQEEISKKQFGISTIVAIRSFQKIQLLPVTKEVVETTAGRLNQVLESKGAFSQKEKKPGKSFTNISVKPDFLNVKLSGISQKDKQASAQIDIRLNEYFIDQLSVETGPISVAMREALLKSGANLKDFEGQELKELFTENLLPGFSKNLLLKKEAEKLLKKISTIQPDKLDVLLQKEIPLKEHPAFQKEILVAKNEKIFSLAEVNLTGKPGLKIDLEEADDQALQQLEAKGIINGKQKSNLKLYGELSRLTGSNFTLIESLKEKNVQSLEELIPLEKTDWLELIRKKTVEIPEELTPDEYAERMISTIEEVFPTQKLFFKIKDAGQKFINQPDSLPLLANTYRHLGFTEILQDANITEASKKEVMQNRLNNFEKLYSQ